DLVQPHALTNVEFAVLLIDLLHVTCNQVHVVVEQVTLGADQLIALSTDLVKWQVQPAGHIRVFPGAVNQGDFRLLAVQGPCQQIGHNCPTYTTADNQNMLGHTTVSFVSNGPCARQSACSLALGKYPGSRAWPFESRPGYLW